jgi:hypothetical protein
MWNFPARLLAKTNGKTGGKGASIRLMDNE